VVGLVVDKKMYIAVVVACEVDLTIVVAEDNFVEDNTFVVHYN
jgi:hypothetical protein